MTSLWFLVWVVLGWVMGTIGMLIYFLPRMWGAEMGEKDAHQDAAMVIEGLQAQIKVVESLLAASQLECAALKASNALLIGVGPLDRKED